MAKQILRIRPAAILVADDIVERHLHVLEEDFVDFVVFIQRDDGTYRDARRLHVDQQERDALLLLRAAIGAHEAEHHVGMLAERGPRFLTVHDVVIADALCTCAQRREIRPRAGLRIALAPPVGAVENARQVVALLRLAAIFHQHWRDHRHAERQHGRRTEARALLVPDVPLCRVPAWAAVFGRPRGRRPATRAEQLVPAREIVAIQTFVIEDLVAQLTRQIRLEPGADVGAKRVVGGGIIQIHALLSPGRARYRRRQEPPRRYCSGSFSATGTGSGITSMPSSTKALASSGVVTPRMLRAGASL